MHVNTYYEIKEKMQYLFCVVMKTLKVRVKITADYIGDVHSTTLKLHVAQSSYFLFLLIKYMILKNC